MKVFVQNLGKYNEGEIKGDWLQLPSSKENIDKFLREEVGLQLTQKEVDEALAKDGVCYEEYMIADIETNLSCYDYYEYENVYNLNVLASYENKANDIEVINGYCERASIYDIQGICNVIMQEDEICVTQMPDYCKDISSYVEQIGYTYAKENCLEEQFDKAGLSEYYQYFDIESYGRDLDLSNSLFVTDNSIIDIDASSVDAYLYSIEDLEEMEQLSPENCYSEKDCNEKDYDYE